MTIAGLIPEEVVNDIRQRVNIVDVVAPYVSLRKRGQNYFGVCPFHEERTGSFSVNEDKQIFHCFSCGRGGNVFSFIMDIEHLTFPQAVAKVAPMAGVAVDEYMVDQSNERPVSDEVRELRALYNDAMKLYHHLLVNTEAGDGALTYLHDRGLDDGTIDAFMLGYAPKENVLLSYFTEQGKDYQLLRKSELFVEHDDGTLVDRFSDRVLFTIRDKQGHPIAFSGRRLNSDDSQPKYINSPESPLFNKSVELFNLDLSQDSIRQSKSVILLEGYMDVIAAFQAGVTNTVASMGTSLTQQQVKVLGRLADEIFISYDADSAGQNATKRALDMIEQDNQLDVKIVFIPNQQDPDEFFRSQGADAFKALLQKNVETPLTFRLRFLRQNFDLNQFNGQANYVNEALGIIAQQPEPVVRDVQLRQLASEFDISLDALTSQIRPLLMQQQAMRTTTPGANINPAKREFDDHQATPYQEDASAPVLQYNNVSQVSGVQRAQQILLSWMLRQQEVWLQVTALPDFHFADANYETIVLLASAFKQEHQSTDGIDLAEFMDFVRRPELTRIIAELDAVPVELQTDRNLVDDYVQVIMNKIPLTDKIKTLRREFQEAKQLGDNARMRTKGAELMNALKLQEARRFD